MSAAQQRALTSRRYRLLLVGQPVLSRIAERHGRPDPFDWGDGRGETSNFAGLLLHVISQQISTTVALVLFDRLVATIGGSPEPASVAALGPDGLRELGLSHDKSSCLVDLAQRHLDGRLDTTALGTASDAHVIESLTAVRGVGRWTAEMFLIHQLRRPDVLPAGDLGIRHAVASAWKLPETPSMAKVRERGEGWAPYRTFAAALLWASLPSAPRSREPEAAPAAAGP